MSRLSDFSNWNTSLCFYLNVDNNILCDFNRFLYKDIPSTKHVQLGKSLVLVERSDFIFQLAVRFKEKIDEGASHHTLSTLYSKASIYLRWCDQKSIESFTQASIERYMESEYERLQLGNIKRSTYSQTLSKITSLFTDYLDLPRSWFLTISHVGCSDTEPFEAYTRSDLNQLLPFLRKLFNQTTTQFLENPQKHITAHYSNPSMTFHWQGQDYPLCAAISKMMCAATYLLSYYTYSNTSTLLSLNRPNNASMSIGDTWYTMPAFKRRAFKTIQVEIGEHQVLEIPKYSMSFFDTLLKISRELGGTNEKLLLQTIVNNKQKPIKRATLQSFCERWLERHFSFKDQAGRKLRPVISRFRETGSQLTSYYQGELVNDIMLNNTPNTRKKHYSQGNKHLNNGMLQDTLSIRQEQAKNKQGAQSARKSLDLKVLVIEDEYKSNLPNLSRTPNGSSCANPFGKKSETYMRKARKRNLVKEGEKLACADLLGCFGCSEQVIVQSVSDLWCLLSFKMCIEESLYLHLDTSHYRKNFEKVIIFINQKILPNLNKSILKKAESMVENEGLHPLWNEVESIIDLVPKVTQRQQGDAQ
ncbi:hypothetical protein [Shewanella indica]|uniref:hypothetical protein n=1 Tax=Shewanella indica TaxID=768528 RepID=UPI003999660F